MEINKIKEYKTLTHQNGYNISAGGDTCNVKGEKVNTARLTEKQVLEIIHRRKLGDKSKDVYNDFINYIGFSGFQQVWRGKNWTYLQDQDTVNIIKGNAKFSLAEIRKIKLAFKEGKTSKEVAKEFNMCYHTAYNIKAGISYSNITV